MERELSRDGSHYSISSGILPSLGARSNRRVKLRPFIVSPYDRRYRSAARFPPLRCQFRICSSAQRVLRFICHRATPSLGGGLRPRAGFGFLSHCLLLARRRLALAGGSFDIGHDGGR